LPRRPELASMQKLLARPKQAKDGLGASRAPSDASICPVRAGRRAPTGLVRRSKDVPSNLLWTRAGLGQGRVVLVTGEPGMGKTELCEQPLFATRLVQLLVERGDIRQADGRWQLCVPASELNLAVPASVRGVLEKKLETLQEADRRALECASVMGAEFSSAALAELLSMDELALEERLELLARVHRLVEPLLGERPLAERSPRYRFSHVLYQTLLYEGLAGKRRE